MSRARTFLERVRHTFWILPAIGIVLGAVLGLAIPALDTHLHLPDELSVNGGADTARGVLQAIVGVAVSVAGISFSVIVVALVLASQQLSPRVVRSFQRNPLNQAVLAVFLGTAIYAVVVLSSVNEDEFDPVPEFATTVAMGLSAISLALFVVFLHHLLRSLNASAVIRRIAAEGQQAIEAPHPQGAGRGAHDVASLEAELSEFQQRAAHRQLRAPRAGYLATVEAAEIVKLAAKAEMFVEQRKAIGDFVVTGATLATVWAKEEPSEALLSEISAGFVLNEERIVDHDIAFPIRQLADVALKGLSPGINDPTTAENAMDSVTDSLVRVSLQDWGTELRLDDRMTPRLRISRPSFDQLVRLGFDQVRRDAARRPSFSVRLLELLRELRELGGQPARESDELSRQALLVREHTVALCETQEDERMVVEAYERLHT